MRRGTGSHLQTARRLVVSTHQDDVEALLSR
jgi:hypothetical protein